MALRSLTASSLSVVPPPPPPPHSSSSSSFFYSFRRTQLKHNPGCSITLRHKLAVLLNRRAQSHVVMMAPEEKKLARRSPLDFPIEWERPKLAKRPDIFPQFGPMKTPLPPPLPADPPEEDEEDEEKKVKEEKQEEDPDEEIPEDPWQQ